MTATIGFFRNEYEFLSNFYPHRVWFEGIWYPSNEHAFQAAKTRDLKTRVEISKLPGDRKGCSKAKQMGRRCELRADWEDVKYDIMKRIVIAKFGDAKLAEKLLATDDKRLVEGNDWHDNIWGNCICQRADRECRNILGTNWLGQILMEVRDSLRKGYEL